MSQSRTRRAVSGARGAVSAAREAAATRPSGDSGAGKPQQNHRSKSRNKIPKSVRYDLENALLGLCDVWFEEIKPHLIQNNIKLHVDGAANDGGVAADGDHRRAAAVCTHLDPGAALDRRQHPAAGYVGCCRTQPIASRAPCRRPPAHCPTASLSPQPLTNPTQISYGDRPRPSFLSPALHSLAKAALKQVRLNDEQKANSTDQNRTKRRSRRKQARPPPEAPLPQGPWRVPRLCRTYAPKFELPRSTRTASPSPPRHFLNKDSPKSRPQPRVLKKNFEDTLESWKNREQSHQDFTNCTPVAKFPLKHEKKKKLKVEETSSLFSPGLINIIGEKNDKRLRILFKNPITEDSSPSTMNLVTSPENSKKKRTSVKKMPWR